MKKLNAYFLMLMMGLSLFTACDDDGPTPASNDFDRPGITAPTTGLAVQMGQSATFTVPVEAEGKIASINVSADKGTATLSNQDALVGQTSGNAQISYQAPEAAGSAVITVTVTDAQDPAKTETETFVVQITEEPQPNVVDVYASPEGIGTTTWTKDNIYVLRGFVFVNDGQTLTIEAGTVIKGQPGQGTGSSALIIAKGGRIMAEGTAEEPIIFTALSDDLNTIDDLPVNARGLWGGVILLGNAPINHANAQTNIEGIPSTETRGAYGGNNADDNSGVMKYVSIRHGGTNIGAGNEINGLTMGGVGRGTQISYIEVFGNDDDGFEWFGGTVNSSYLASIYNQDDSFDWDFGWRGQNQFWLAYQEQGFTDSDRGFESDGAHSGNLSAPVFSNPQIYNLTLIGQGATGNSAEAMFMTEGTGAHIANSIIMNFATGIELTDVGSTGMNSRDRLTNGDLVFRNNIFYSIGAEGVPASWLAVSHDYQPLAAHLAENGNVLANPALGGIAQGAFNPLPNATGAAFTTGRYAYPDAAVDGFTYEAVDFIGAFGEENWLQGWTAADAYGLLQ